MRPDTPDSSPARSATQNSGAPGARPAPALLIPARCSKSREPFLVRIVEKKSGLWTAVSAAAIAEARLRNPEFQSSQASGRLKIGEEYEGCAHCKQRGLFLHEECDSRLSCCAPGDNSVICGWCGASIPVKIADTAKVRGIGD